MAIYAHKWRTAFITLLLGFIASSISTSALANATSDYTTFSCAGCHGTPFGTGSVTFNVAQVNTAYPTNAALANFITTNMPPPGGACNTACGQEMADFIRPLPPVADVSQSTNLSGVAPVTANFNGSMSSCDNGCISYAWTFGDSSSGSGVMATHTYTAAGTYTATLTVTDAQGAQNSISVMVTVTAAAMPPVANASRSSNLSGVAPLNVSFDGSLSTCTGGCSLYTWTSSDNAIFTSGIKVNDIVQLVGTHIVTLLVIDAQGLRSTTNLTVTVTASANPPVANASSSSNLKGAAPLTVQFGDLSTCNNTCSNATWNFGDGSTGTSLPGNGVTHIYTTPGTYTATLTATDAANGKQTSTTVQVIVVPAESLTAYVSACQTQLGFQNVSIPAMNCLNGDLFDTRTPKNDYLLYEKIADQVDLAVACRWVSSATQSAVSIEMLIYNRQNGDTCYFSAISRLLPNIGIAAVPVNIVSPTDPAASSFWHQPADVDAGVRCIGCHVSGPYIATPLIAPFLAKDGLMNNGHDTGSNITTADLTQSFNTAHVKYHAISATVNGVPGAFSLWDSLKQSYIDPNQSSCSLGCHVIGTLSPQSDVSIANAGNVLARPVNELLEITQAGVMPANAPAIGDPSDSAYSWINNSNPFSSGSTGDTETLVGARSSYPALLTGTVANPGYCPGAPAVIEAHAVGNNNAFIVAQQANVGLLPDRLSAFNLRDGLVCLNSDQEPGQTCSDYQTRYQCTDPTGNQSWTAWYNNDSPTTDSSGDNESRSKIANLCSSPTGSVATTIEATTLQSNGWTYSAYGSQ